MTAHPLRRTLLVVAALCAAMPAMAGAQHDAVMDLLNAYEATATADQLKALGEGVDAELMAIADDSGVAPSRRGRAVTALQYFPSETSKNWLATRLVDDAAEAIVRRKAALSLGVVAGAEGVTALTTALSATDAQLRIAAAQALGKVGTPEAVAALQGRLANEPETAVRMAIATAMGSAQ